MFQIIALLIISITLTLSLNNATTNTSASLPLNLEKERPLRIVMSSTESYMPQFLNWFIFYHNACPDLPTIFFICLDKGSQEPLSKLGIPCAELDHHLPTNYTRSDVWLLRTRVTKDLLQEGFDVLLSDIDAIWLHNPLPILSNFANNGSDVVASRAIFPTTVSTTFGATACMGFIYIRSSNNTVSLWSALIDLMSSSSQGDDQRDFNHLLVNSGLTYEQKPTYTDSRTESTGAFVHNGTEMRLTLLPHNQFMRTCDKRHKALSAVVAHCVGKTNPDRRVAFQKYHGIWALDNNTSNITGRHY